MRHGNEAPQVVPVEPTDDGWAFAAPYLTLMRPDAPQLARDPREVFAALRWLVCSGTPWRYLPGDFPPRQAVYQQTRRRLEAGCFEAMAHDLLARLRRGEGRADDPTAAILDGRAVRSTREGGTRAGDNGPKRRTGRKLHPAVDPRGHLLAPRATPADEQDRAQVAEPAAAAQEATGQRVEVVFVDRGDAGEQAAADAAARGVRLEAVKLPAARRGFVLLPRRWAAVPRLRLPDAATPRHRRRPRSITRSSRRRRLRPG